MAASSESYHQLSLGTEDIVWVDTKDGFHACLEHLCGLPGGVVGMDGEWKPCFGETIVSRWVILEKEFLYAFMIKIWCMYQNNSGR